jgi:hypothetical protein
VLAWINFLTTSRWAAQAGALHGWRKPWYGLALAAATLLVVVARHEIGRPARIGRAAALTFLAAGAALLLASLFHRLPLSVWSEIPFKDDWTELFQMTVNGVALLRRGAVVGWNWWFLGGYPTSTDIAQNFGLLAFLPMTILGNTLGYHVLHAVLFVAVPVFVWWDLGGEEPETRILATAFACFFGAGYLYTLTSSGDTNSMVGVFCAGLALAGSHAARRGRRWGGPLMMAALTVALGSHAAFAVYAGLYLLLESLYFRDRAAFVRLALATGFAAIAALPVHWELLRYPEFVSFNNTVYQHGEPIRWGRFARNAFYNLEILALPQRWFNDYRSLANVWLLPMLLVAVTGRATRIGFYAACAVLTQALLGSTRRWPARCSTDSAHAAAARGRRWRASCCITPDGVRWRSPSPRCCPLTWRRRSSPCATCPTFARSIRRSSTASPRAMAASCSSKSARIATWTAIRCAGRRRRPSTCTSRACCPEWPASGSTAR